MVHGHLLLLVLANGQHESSSGPKGTRQEGVGYRLSWVQGSAVLEPTHTIPICLSMSSEQERRVSKSISSAANRLKYLSMSRGCKNSFS